MVGPLVQPSSKKRQILIVEDEFLVALALKQIAEALDCEVVGPLRRLPSAWEAARDLALDAALLDIRIDGGTVFPVAKMLQQRGIPFAFVTAVPRSIVSPYADAPVLIKPFDDTDVETLLLELLRGPAAPFYGRRSGNGAA